MTSMGRMAVAAIAAACVVGAAAFGPAAGARPRAPVVSFTTALGPYADARRLYPLANVSASGITFISNSSKAVTVGGTRHTLELSFTAAGFVADLAHMRRPYAFPMNAGTSIAGRLLTGSTVEANYLYSSQSGVTFTLKSYNARTHSLKGTFSGTLAKVSGDGPDSITLTRAKFSGKFATP